MGDDILLLSDESLICQGPDDIILTSDGWLAIENKHNYEGLTRLHRMLNISAINDAEIIDDMKRRILRTFAFIVLLLGCVTCLIYPFTWGIDAFIYGIESHKQNSNWGAFFGVIGILAPVAAILCLKTRYFGAVLLIHHKSGIMEVKQEQMNILTLIWLFCFLFAALSSPTPNWGAVNYGLAEYAILTLPIIIAVWHLGKRELYYAEEKESGKEEHERINKVSLYGFKKELFKLCGFDGDERQIKPTNIYETFRIDIDKLRKGIKKLEDDLEQLLPRYSETWLMPSPTAATSHLRSQTELLLKKRLEKILPNRSKGGSNKMSLGNYRTEIKNHDVTSNGEILQMIDILRELGNSATHGDSAPATKYTFLEALQKFFVIVLWHYANPPIPKVKNPGE
jgi:hypothetical protein